MAVTQMIDSPTGFVGGGAVGVGAPVALREFVDKQTGPLVTGSGDTLARFTTPSALWGLGVGSLTGALWMLDAGPGGLDDFYLSHALAGIPTGVWSAFNPVETGSNGGGGSAGASRQRAMRNGSRDADHAGEFAPSGGRSAELQPSN